MNVLQQFISCEAAQSVSMIVEFTHIYRNDEGGHREMGLPETRVSRVAKLTSLNIPSVLRHMFAKVKTRINNSEVSGSGWVFDRFVHITLRATTDVIINSDLADNVVGGKTHPSYIMTEAVEGGQGSSSSRKAAGDEDDEDDEMTSG